MVGDSDMLLSIGSAWTGGRLDKKNRLAAPDSSMKINRYPSYAEPSIVLIAGWAIVE